MSAPVISSHHFGRDQQQLGLIDVRKVPSADCTPALHATRGDNWRLAGWRLSPYVAIRKHLPPTPTAVFPFKMADRKTTALTLAEATNHSRIIAYCPLWLAAESAYQGIKSSKF
jgi:hypothetical protein